MTVEELIAALQKHDPRLPVGFYGAEGRVSVKGEPVIERVYEVAFSYKDYEDKPEASVFAKAGPLVDVLFLS